MVDKRFVLDSNVFIEAHRRYYAFDIAPCFWRVLLELAHSGHIVSIDKVKVELTSSEDVLHEWSVTNFDCWFMSTDVDEVVEAYRDVINWVFSQEQFFLSAKEEFSNVADSWIVAYAKAYNCAVVTQEIYNKDKKNKVLIPNVCEAFGIEYVNTFGMLRKLKASLGN